MMNGNDHFYLQEELLASHRRLDSVIRSDLSRPFVSGWSIENPHARDLFLSQVSGEDSSADKYELISDDSSLCSAIAQFHLRRDKLSYHPKEIFIGAGSSPLLLALMGMLKARNITTLHYLPPVYYAYYFWARLLGIRMCPVAEGILSGTVDDWSLPQEQSTLLVSDPIWVSGSPLTQSTIEKLAAWQSKTESLIIVDGTFQYMKWDSADSLEYSSLLAKPLTIRLVCPTKSVGAHTVRFSYLLIPEDYREDVRYVASNATGATDTVNIRGAKEIMKALNSVQENRKFIEHIKSRHRHLHGRIYSELSVEPSCGYYAFGRLIPDASQCITMDRAFFELPESEKGIRLNILVPSRELAKLPPSKAQ